MNIQCDEPLLDFASKSNLRRYNKDDKHGDRKGKKHSKQYEKKVKKVGKRAREVGRCRLTVYKSVLKASTVSVLETII